MNINISGGQLNIAGGNSTIRVDGAKGQVNMTDGNGRVVNVRAGKSYSARKEGKDYVVRGTDGEIDKNICVQGNIIVNGTHNIILSGPYVQGRKDLVIEGNLIVYGTNHDINNIVQLNGNIIDNGMRNIIR